MLTRSKSFRLRLVMKFARLLGVPVDVNGRYFGNVSSAREGTRI